MKHIVALSGGKDSTAMALRLAEVEPRDYTYVITPTGNELPEMFAHWRRVSDLLGKPLVPILHGKRSLQGLIRQQHALPNHAARWCTRMLKLEPYYGWLSIQTPCVSYVGLRADEESRPGMIFPDADGIQMDFPMRRWDCAVCFWQRIGEWFLLWRDNLSAFMEGEELEEGVIAQRGEVRTFRSPQRDSWPARLRDLRAEFEKGRIPKRSLDMMDKRRLVGTCRVCML